ncbi:MULTISPECIES: RDD family protein [unclassified Streptomyces]|uniref:RDD family protein n=1 Tax=unclassified Streptomyces TaxID=2593676 RepID=UPI003805E79A
MATPPGGGGEVPQAGYYPDPSIPGYIRYWSGGAWVPGTSRPAPGDGEAPPHPPAGAAPAGPVLASGPAVTPVAAGRPEPVAPAATAPTAPTRDRNPAPEPAWNPAPAERGTPLPPQLPAHGQGPAAQPPGPDRPSAAAPPRLPAQIPVPARQRPVPAPAPVPAVEETGPVFLDEDPEPYPGPAPAWQADSSRQTGFGGDRDQRVSWGAPRPATADPRTPADWPVAGGGEPVAPAPVADPRTPGGASRLGGMPVTPAPTPAPVHPGPAPGPQASTPVPQGSAPVPVPSAAPPRQTAAPAPAPVPPNPAPASAHPGPPAVPQQTRVAPGAPAWERQAPPQEQQPVAPWKPPVEDVFTRAARAQASARPAPLGRRLLARVIDTIVLGGLSGAAALPFVTAALDHIDGKIEEAKQSGVTVQVWLVDSTTSVQFGIALAALLVLGVLYEVVPTARWGRTLGKKLCGISVRDIEGHEPPGFGASLRRWLVHGVLNLLVVGVLNVAWCLFDRPWKQCWHDKAAGTFVAR